MRPNPAKIALTLLCTNMSENQITDTVQSFRMAIDTLNLAINIQRRGHTIVLTPLRDDAAGMAQLYQYIINMNMPRPIALHKYDMPPIDIKDIVKSTSSKTQTDAYRDFRRAQENKYRAMARHFNTRRK